MKPTTSFESELLLTVYAAFAQEESFSISENMRGGIRQRFKLGIPKVSQVYGYDNTERGVLSINEEKAEVVRKIYQMYLDGASTIEIADALNELNVPPPIESSQLWYPNSVKCILRNEKYGSNLRTGGGVKRCEAISIYRRKMKNQKLWIDRNAPQISNTDCV